MLRGDYVRYLSQLNITEKPYGVELLISLFVPDPERFLNYA